jgi:hypothetical protein
MPQPENTPCGGGGGRFCCSGTCVEVEPTYYSCGGCAITCPAGDICTSGHSCTCTESSVCVPGGSLQRHTCRSNAGLCVTSTEGELACVWESHFDPSKTCNTSADCPQSIICVGSGTNFVCSSDWICTKSTCYPTGVCVPTLPDGRPL